MPPHQYFFIKTPSLKGLPTKAEEDPSPHEMRLSPLDINPIFSGLQSSILNPVSPGHQPSISWSFLVLLLLLLLLLLFLLLSLLL